MLNSFFRWSWASAVLGLIFTLIQVKLLPPYAGFDEPAHFSSVLSYRFNHGHPKHPGSFFHAQVEEAIRLTPVPVHQLAPWKQHGGISYLEWAQLPEIVKQEKHSQYLSLKASAWEEGHVFGNWQAQHPPLYYWTIGNLLKLFPTESLSELFDISRILSGAIYSLFYFILAYFFCRRWGYDSKILWWAVFLPMPYVLGARITNDALAIPAFTLSLCLYFDLFKQERTHWTLRRIIPIALALALTLGSKAYVLSMGPVLFVMGLVLYYADRDLKFLDRLKRPFIVLAPLVLMLLIWSPWLYGNYKRTGSITGMNELADLHAWGVDTFHIRFEKLKELYTVHLHETLWIWLGVVVHFMFVSHWYAGTAYPLFYVFQALIYLLPLYLVFRKARQMRLLWNLNTLLYFLITVAFVYGWFKFILDLYLYHGRPEWVGGWYYWATGSALILFYAEVFSHLKNSIQRIFVLLQLIAFVWCLFTQWQFFSGQWGRHSFYKYPVRTSTIEP